MTTQQISHEQELKRLSEVLRNDIVYIEQLCSMVNNYAGKLGLGRKVRAEDFTEKARNAREAIKKPLCVTAK